MRWEEDENDKLIKIIPSFYRRTVACQTHGHEQAKNRNKNIK